jgi:hypothetical protein
MSEFELYFELGLEHILDIKGYDHIMFVIALCAIYAVRDWVKVLILVTAFTIGHSITLALATLQIISVNSDLIEFLIPLTIFLTAFSNLFIKTDTIRRSKIQINYILALFFGLIHGMGFSNYLRSLLGMDESIITQLLAFNIGLEAGQIIIVGSFMVFSFILTDIFGVNRRDWKLIISSAVVGISLIMIFEAKYW